IAVLADAVGAVCGLIFYSGIPPSIKMHHMRCRCQIQSRTACLDSENDKGGPISFLKRINNCLPFANRCATMEHQPSLTKYLCQKGGNRLSHLAKLGKDKHLLLARSNLIADSSETVKFAAVGGVIYAIAE